MSPDCTLRNSLGNSNWLPDIVCQKITEIWDDVIFLGRIINALKGLSYRQVSYNKHSKIHNKMSGSAKRCEEKLSRQGDTKKQECLTL